MSKQTGGCEMICEDRFFEKVLPNIGSPRQVFHELVQNAVRAKATEVRLEAPNGVYTVTNDGEVLEDFTKLFIVADTGYDPDVERAHNPAGMGMILLYSIAEKVSFHSGDRSLVIDCDRYFVDPEYRKSLSGRITKTNTRVDGMRVVITPKKGDQGMKEAWVDAATKPRSFAFYPLRVLIGGNEIERIEPEDYPVCIPGNGPLEHTLICVSLTAGDQVIWHGQPIRRAEYETRRPIDIFVMGPNDTFRPAFPDRRFLRNSREELVELFWEAERQAREAIFDHLIRLDKEKRYTHLVKLLSNLKQPYDREWGAWKFEVLEDSELTWQALSKEDAGEARIFHEEDEFDLEIVGPNNLEANDRKRSHIPLPAIIENMAVPMAQVGGTKMPEWVKKLVISERPKIRIVRTKGGAENRFWVYGHRAEFVEKIEVEGIEEAPDFIYLQSMDYLEPELYMVENPDLSPLVSHFCEANDNFNSWDDIYEEVDESIKEARMKLRKEADVSHLWGFLEREGALEEGAMSVAVTLNRENGTVTVGDKRFKAKFL